MMATCPPAKRSASVVDLCPDAWSIIASTLYDHHRRSVYEAHLHKAKEAAVAEREKWQQQGRTGDDQPNEELTEEEAEAAAESARCSARFSASTEVLSTLFAVCKGAATGVALLLQSDRGCGALNKKQLEAVVEATVLGRSIFLTGGAGVGKSHASRAMQEFMPMHFVTPTGGAAVNVNGSTVHLAFNIRRRAVEPSSTVYVVEESGGDALEGEDDEPPPSEPARGGEAEPVMREVMILTPDIRTAIRGLRTLAIDEVSMISGDIFKALDMGFRKARGIDEPLGGVQLVAVGDFYQLPPVNGAYAFETPAWSALMKGKGRRRAMKHIELTENMRQRPEERQFIEVLARCRVGRLTWDDINWFRRASGVAKEGDGAALDDLLCFSTGRRNAGYPAPPPAPQHARSVAERNEHKIATMAGETIALVNPQALCPSIRSFTDPHTKATVKIGAHRTARAWAASNASHVEQARQWASSRGRPWDLSQHLDALGKCKVRTRLEEPLSRSSQLAVPHPAATPTFTFKIGTRVRCTTNVYDRTRRTRSPKLYNGQLGTIVGVVLRPLDGASDLDIPQDGGADMDAYMEDARSPTRARVALDSNGAALVDADALRSGRNDGYAVAVRVLWDATGHAEAFETDVRRRPFRREQSRATAQALLGASMDCQSLVHVTWAFPLAVAFARTIHSAQGATMNKCADLNLFNVSYKDETTGEFTTPPGLGYVGLSRFTRAALIRFVGSTKQFPFNPFNCKADPRVRHFYECVERLEKDRSPKNDDGEVVAPFWIV